MCTLSPSNFVWTNPDLFKKTVQSGGINLVHGTEIAFNHILRRSAGLPPPGAVHNIVPHEIHLMGYCLGGTLAMIVAAAMGRDKDKRLKSLSLLAAQGDFTEAGELMLFITESEISFLKNMMWEQGYLDTKQLAGSFQMLRTYDLIWSKMIDDYMTGTQRGMIDLLAWNADATRLPYKMHTGTYVMQK